MSGITALKDQINTKTVNLVLLTVATAGIYPILWLDRNLPVLDKITGLKTADRIYIVWLAVCAGLSGAFTTSGGGTMDAIGYLLTIATSVLYIVWAFRARKALQEYALNEHRIDLRMNGFYTFIFHIYYINYCINDLPEMQRKQQILAGQVDGLKNGN